MSEYQYHEFVAVDQPLTAKQMSALRAYSTRAKITATRFQNEYHWGDFKADPKKLLLRYFDGYLYFANWGTHRLILRLNKSQVDRKALTPYGLPLSSSGEFLAVDLTSNDEPYDYYALPRGMLARLLPLRTELMRGELRPAYLGWLLAAQQGAVEEGSREPPVPPGLAELTSAQKAMVAFLNIDRDLIAAAIHVEAPSRSKRRRTLGSLFEYAEKRRARRGRRAD